MNRPLPPGGSASDANIEQSELELIAYLFGRQVRFALPHDGDITLGRSEQNGVRLVHHSVSRMHARITCRKGAATVEDLGSRNGTRVFSSHVDPARAASADETHASSNEWKLDPGEMRPLQSGDTIRLGSVLVRVGHRAATVSEGERMELETAIVVDPASRAVYDLAQRVAPGDLSVLILGETGVGKDVLAQTIHAASNRARGPFIRIHCAALAENLLESELFGHVRGAFTGALQAKRGLIEAASGGTVFLDELGEMGHSTQVKLLNVLETGEVLPVGATRPVKIDVRFISATNRDLANSVAQGKFRRDLYFRVNGVTLHMPPLRERPLDIEPMARKFLAAAAKKANKEGLELDPDAIQELVGFPFTGNVRELKNVIERAVLLCRGTEIRAEDLVMEGQPLPLDAFDGEEHTEVFESPRATAVWPPHVARASGGASGPSAAPPGTAGGKTRERVEEALRSCSGNQTRAAELLGVSRRTLVNWLNEFDIGRPRKR